MTPGWPRLALRLRTLVIALGIGMILAISCLGIGSASAATRARLAVSLNPDRSSAVRFDGSTVKGKIYVFVRNSRNLGKVDFYLDNSSRTKPPVRTDRRAPFDLAGTARDGTARPYDTTKLADGTHRIRVVLTWADGSTSSRRREFAVANKGVQPTTKPYPRRQRAPHQPRRQLPQLRPRNRRLRRQRQRRQPHNRQRPPRSPQRQRQNLQSPRLLRRRPLRQRQPRPNRPARQCRRLPMDRGRARLRQRSAATRQCSADRPLPLLVRLSLPPATTVLLIFGRRARRTGSHPVFTHLARVST